MAQMADLEELALSCKNQTSRVYVSEAIGAYHAGSIRSAIVITWIAVHYDLVSKIRSLAAGNAPDAIQWIRDFDKDYEKYRPEDPTTIRPIQKREETILNDALNKFNLISQMELVDLKKLREDRHRCAHPSMRSLTELYSPTPETARLHLRHAMEFVLARPAVQGQHAVDRITDLISDEGFPNTREDAFDVLKSSLLSTLNSGEISSVVVSVVKKLLAETTPGQERLQLMSALEGIRDIHSIWFSDSFGAIIAEHIKPDSPLAIYIITTYARSRPWLIQHLDTISMGRVKHLLQTVSLDVNFGREAIISSLWLDSTREWATARLRDFRPEIIEPYKDRIPNDIWLEQAVTRIQKSNSVENTYAVLERQLGNWVAFGELSDAQIGRILAATIQNESVRESIATPKFFEEFLDFPFRKSHGNKELWKRAVDSLKASPTTKQKLLGMVEEIPETEFDINDVPF